MKGSNYLLDLFYYTIEVVLKSWEWQYTDISGEINKPKFFFTSFQKVSIIISIGFVYYTKDRRSFDDNFINYLITSFSIFIGLFVSVLIMFFDKQSILKKPDYNANEIAIYRQSRNFFNQFTYLTTYNILIAVLLITLLILPLIFVGCNTPINILCFRVSYLDTINEPIIYEILKLSLYVFHKILVIYFILNFLSLTVFSISSFTQYSIINFNRNNPEI